MIRTISLLSPVSGARACKNYSYNPAGQPICTGYSNAATFWYQRPSFSDFDGFVEVLEAAERSGRQLAVHGERIEYLPKHRVNRRLHSDPTLSEPPCFRENPSGTGWVMADVDDFPNKWGTPSTTEEMRALTWGVLSQVLPPEFHEAYYWYQWSNGMLVNSGWENIKLHLWFMLDRPFTDTVLCQWATNLGTIDPCVYRTVQPNYLAPPTFVGMPDPVGAWRSGAVREFGTREAVDLNYTYQPPHVMVQRSAAAIKLQQHLWQQAGKRFRYLDPDHVSPPIRKIAEIGVNGRCHGHIIASAASWVTCCGVNPDSEAWKKLVRERVALSGHKDSSLYSSDRYLDEVFRSAMRKYSSVNPQLPPVPRELIINQNTF